MGTLWVLNEPALEGCKGGDAGKSDERYQA